MSELCILACLFISNGFAVLDHPRAFYGDTPHEPAFRLSTPYDRVLIENPYMVTAVGFEWDAGQRFRVTLQYRHESSAATRRDTGQNSVELTARWFPFRASN
jgi:hypothetical protein